MADGNWIKLNRKIWDNFIWDFDQPKYAMAWIDMLLMANYKDKKILFDGKVETVQRGSFITSMVKLADRWGMNRKTVKSFLDILEQDGMITYKTTKRRTTVFITNYLSYQDFAGFEDDPDGQLNGQLNGQPDGQLNGQLNGHNIRRLKKVKESEEGKETSSTVSKETVCSTDVQRIVEAWNALGLSKVKKIVPGTNRDTLLRARLKDYGVADILEAIENIKKSTFLRGGGEKGWVITFDWLIKPNKFPKVLGGDYNDNTNPPAQPAAPRRGRTEMVPWWMDKEKMGAAIDENKKLFEDLAEYDRLEAEAKKTPEDPELQERIKALKKRLSKC